MVPVIMHLLCVLSMLKFLVLGYVAVLNHFWHDVVLHHFVDFLNLEYFKLGFEWFLTSEPLQLASKTNFFFLKGTCQILTFPSHMLHYLHCDQPKTSPYHIDDYFHPEWALYSSFEILFILFILKKSIHPLNSQCLPPVLIQVHGSMFLWILTKFHQNLLIRGGET